MKRRTALLAASAATALAAGAAIALRRARGTDAEPDELGAGADVWAFEFEALSGPAVALRALRGQPLLLNFWATWCVPCVVEMPLLDAFARTRTHSGWRVLALAVDQRGAVQRFVADRALTLPVALAGAAGIDLSRALGNRVGALPFTAVFDRQGEIAARKLGAVSREQLEAWARAIA